MTERENQLTEWTAQQQKEQLDRREKFFILDVRNGDEFAAWPIEGPETPPTVNVPYFEMLEEGDGDDFVDSVMAYARRVLAEQLPADQPILAVCAKGDTSAFVAEALRRLGYNALNLEGGMRAWGDFYEIKPVAAGEKLGVYQVSRPARGCLSYIVASDGVALFIDPLRHVEHYLDFACDSDLQIELLLDTHGHADHISSGAELAKRLERPYYLHPYDAIHPIDVLPAVIEFEYLYDGLEFTVGSAHIRTIHVPGHTLGNVVFLLDDKYLFTGDSIFINSIARPDLGGRAETWAPIHYRSLSRLLELPDEVVVLPGHSSSPREATESGLFQATLGELKQRNEGLLMAQRSEAEFCEYIVESLPEFPKQYIDIKRVNTGLLEVDEEEASELELGKNICALVQVYQEQ